MIWVISGEIGFKVKIEADSEEEAISIVESNLGILDDDGEVEGEHLVYMANKKRMCRECVTSTCSFLQQPISDIPF